MLFIFLQYLGDTNDVKEFLVYHSFAVAVIHLIFIIQCHCIGQYSHATTSAEPVIRMNFKRWSHQIFMKSLE